MNFQFLITRSLYENSNYSQRDLAKKFSVSLGKINSEMRDAVAEGLLKKESANYSVTDKGIKYLNKHKVDAAIIFACGMGVRLAPLTYDTPKSFIKIKGERMIERQIEQLKSVGINDITIMVGYLAEKFDYLVDKYNVKLVYNEEYKVKNTLATFHHAIDYIRNRNVYICVSDVYISENIYHEFECEPYYTGALYDDCKNEWRYIYNTKNEIKGVELGGENDYCLVGPCFLTKEFSDRLIPIIEKNYNSTKSDNFYWEEAFVYDIKDFPTIYVYKHDKNVIYEFDTLKDIKAFDENAEEYGSEAITFVAKALNIKESEINDIECIKEGMTNKSYKFNCRGITYIARIPGEGTNKFINRKNEYEVYKALEKSNITEEVIFFDENNGYKISKYFNNARIIDINKEKELKDCMSIYYKLHSLPVTLKNSCDIIDMIDEYLNIIKKKEIVVQYEDFDIVIGNCRKLEKIVITEKRPKTICHGDPNPGNVLYTKDGLKIIDFEYTGMADPLSDIALFGAYVGFDIEKTKKLYHMYKESADKNDKTIIMKDDKKAERLIVCYMALSGLYNALWALVREAVGGIDYGSFGLRGYRLFKDCYKYLQKEI